MLYDESDAGVITRLKSEVFSDMGVQNKLMMFDAI